MTCQTKIEWTESTWNPVTGCTKISEGCRNCYAERMARRLKAMGQPNYSNEFALTLHPHVVQAPMTWKRPQMIFVNSMSDLFHERVPLGFIQEVFEVMSMASQHTFQILTKRSERLMELARFLPWPDNIWTGVTVESADYIFRIGHLCGIEARMKFLSIEPMLGPIPGLDLTGIDWVIVGGESGPKARPIRADWVREIRERCAASGTSFFFKQWGGSNKKKAGRQLDGRTWDEIPKVDRCSETVRDSSSRYTRS
jgi:protein gp37